MNHRSPSPPPASLLPLLRLRLRLPCPSFPRSRTTGRAAIGTAEENPRSITPPPSPTPDRRRSPSPPPSPRPDLARSRPDLARSPSPPGQIGVDLPRPTPDLRRSGPPPLSPTADLPRSGSPPLSAFPPPTAPPPLAVSRPASRVSGKRRRPYGWWFKPRRTRPRGAILCSDEDVSPPRPRLARPPPTPPPDRPREAGPAPPAHRAGDKVIPQPEGRRRLPDSFAAGGSKAASAKAKEEIPS